MSAIFALLRGTSRLTAEIRINVGSVGEPGILPVIVPLLSRWGIPEIFRSLAHSARLRNQVALMTLLIHSSLRITNLIWSRVRQFCRT